MGGSANRPADGAVGRAGEPPEGPSGGTCVAEALAWASRLLKEKGVETPRLDAEVLLGRAVGLGRAQLYAYGERRLTGEEWETFRRWVARRAAREPVAYLTGEAEFFGLSLRVSPAVLIPRPDTEILVERVLRWRDRWEAPHIVDVGTGSGAVAAALAVHWPRAVVTAVDFSEEALEVARENVLRHGLAGRVRLLRGDLLVPLAERGWRADIVVSNPPYIPSREIDGLQPEVSRYEPRAALDGGEDGLGVYRRLAAQLPKVLGTRWAVAVEIGAGRAGEVRRILEEALRSAGVPHASPAFGVDADLAGRERVVWATDGGGAAGAEHPGRGPWKSK